MKADEVESIQFVNAEKLRFKQQEEVVLWTYDPEYNTEITGSKTVNYPDRHWWIISDGLLEQLNPPLRSHSDIFDLIISLNLCIDDPVFFSQDPGQVVGGAYTVENGVLEYRDELSMGNIGTALLNMNEIPREVVIDSDIESVYQTVRKYRSKKVETDEEVDIRTALHMYDDALSASLWTAMANLYYVCENLLSSGRSSNTDQLIANQTQISQEEASNWRQLVNRLKHPDKGESVTGILDRDGMAVPTIRRMRGAANVVVKNSLSRTE